MSKDIAASHMVFAIRDRQLDAYMQPFFVKSVGVATRSFTDEVNRAESPMSQHPEDYELFHIGYFFEDTGSIVPVDNVTSVCVASNVHQGNVR